RYGAAMPVAAARDRMRPRPRHHPPRGAGGGSLGGSGIRTDYRGVQRGARRPPGRRRWGVILDLFAGPGGWDEGLRSIGITDVIGMEWDAAACATRAAAGHKTVRCDVSQYPPAPFVGKVRGLIASPPCQA